jgi:hypothetical protein
MKGIAFMLRTLVVARGDVFAQQAKDMHLILTRIATFFTCPKIVCVIMKALLMKGDYYTGMCKIYPIFKFLSFTQFSKRSVVILDMNSVVFECNSAKMPEATICGKLSFTNESANYVFAVNRTIVLVSHWVSL